MLLRQRTVFILQNYSRYFLLVAIAREIDFGDKNDLLTIREVVILCRGDISLFFKMV